MLDAIVLNPHIQMLFGVLLDLGSWFSRTPEYVGHLAHLQLNLASEVVNFLQMLSISDDIYILSLGHLQHAGFLGLFEDLLKATRLCNSQVDDPRIIQQTYRLLTAFSEKEQPCFLDSVADFAQEQMGILISETSTRVANAFKSANYRGVARPLEFLDVLADDSNFKNAVISTFGRVLIQILGQNPSMIAAALKLSDVRLRVLCVSLFLFVCF